MRVLERMGLVEEIKKRETRAGSITMVNENGKVVARLPDGFTSGELEILRGDLANVLYEATRDSAEYVFGDSVELIIQQPDGGRCEVRQRKDATVRLCCGRGWAALECESGCLWR